MVAVEVPAQHRLRGGDAMRSGDVVDDRIIEQGVAAPAERAPRFDDDAP